MRFRVVRLQGREFYFVFYFNCKGFDHLRWDFASVRDSDPEFGSILGLLCFDSVVLFFCVHPENDCKFVGFLFLHLF